MITFAFPFRQCERIFIIFPVSRVEGKACLVPDSPSLIPCQLHWESIRRKKISRRESLDTELDVLFVFSCFFFLEG